MLYRVKLCDFAEAHHLRLTERLVSQELIQVIERLRAGYQDSPGRRDGRAGQQEPAIIVTALQELTMRGDELGYALLKGDKVLPLQEKVFHSEFPD